MKIEFKDLSELKAISNIPDFDNQYEEGKKEITELFKDKDYTLLLVAITGSTSYGLTVEGSDLDFKGIYVENLENILSEFKLGQTKPVIYQNQISNESNDIVFYELGRILELLQTNNPNSLELLATPDDCICYKHPIWDEIIKTLNENKMLTKKCYYTFKQYAYTQIKRATGLNRKINTPVDKKRKTPLDFCNVIFDDDSTMSLRPYLEKNKMDQRLCGLVKVPHAKDLFSLYYDKISDISFSKYISEDIKNNNRQERKINNDFMGLGYKGIIKENNNDEEVSNEIRLSSVPKEEIKICSLSYNKDGYMVYCKSYKEYWGDNGWMNKRNEERYNDNMSNGQGYDCYLEEETEFLTINGWKKYDNIYSNDLLGTLNPLDNSFEWQNYYERFDNIYNGKIYTYENSKIRFSVTDNHKLYFSDCNRSLKNNFSITYNKNNSNWYFQTVNDYFTNKKSHKNILLTSENNNFKDIDVSDDMIRLIGAYISEGSLVYNKNKELKNVYISQLENGRLCEFMVDIKTIKYTITSHNRKNRNELTYIIKDMDIVNYISDNCGRYSYDKKIPDSFFKMSSRQFKILFDTMMAGDGHYHKKKHLIYYTISKVLAEQLHILLTIHGYNSQFYGPYKRDITRKDMYQIFISQDIFRNTLILNKKKGSNNGWSIKDVIEKRIVCFSVMNSILITRNNKKIAIQGNCKNLSHCLRLLYMAKEISESKGIIVRRTTEQRNELLQIKKGKLLYEDIMKKCEELVDGLEENYKNSNLPDEVPNKLISDILLKYRKEIYKL
jgi:hypothetical protein